MIRMPVCGAYQEMIPVRRTCGQNIKKNEPFAVNTVKGSNIKCFSADPDIHYLHLSMDVLCGLYCDQP